MKFLHCEKDERYLSLHDCISEKAYFQNGKLGFTFSDGFWISSEHPDSNLPAVVRTDFSKAEYILEDGEDYDVTVYLFRKSFFNKTLRIEWTLRELVDKINSGKYRLEFLYQYTDSNSRIVECVLRSDKKPYHIECIMKVSATEVRYYWNRLRGDRPW